MTDLTNIAKETLKKDNGFIKNNNYKVLKVEENYCEMEGLITDTSMNPFGLAHGGYIFGLADTAAGIAAMTDEKTALTVNSSIEYLKAAKGKKLLAIAKALKKGKNIAVIEVSIYDEENNLIAKASVTYFYITQ